MVSLQGLASSSHDDFDWPKEDQNEKEKKEMGADSINDDSRLQETKK